MPELTPYFAYGMNIASDAMPVDATAIGPAELPGWRLAFRGFADIDREDGVAVPGALYVVGRRGMEDLDRREGVPNFYVRREVTVDTPDGRVLAEAYVMREKTAPVGPSDGYVQMILRGYREFDLPVGVLYRAAAEAYELEGRRRP